MDGAKEEDGREATPVSILGWQGVDDLCYECWVWNAVRRKKWIVPGVKRMAGWGEHGGGRRFRGGRGTGGRQLGVWGAEEMNHASILEVEEALLAIHVASNGSQELTDPNCSFRLQDARGVQGLEGRFRIRTRFLGSTRVRPASAATATVRASSTRAETTMTR